MAKIADLAVKTGTYTDKNGQEKNRWENIGMEIEADNGGSYFLLKRTFNPAGVPVDDPTREMIRVSRFAVSDEGRSNAGQGQPQGQRQQRASNAPLTDDDIPF